MVNAAADVLVERLDNGIGRILIDRPHRNNAFRLETLEQVSSAVDELAEDADVKAIVLAGKGPNFSAGADFDFLATLRTKSPLEIQDTVYSRAQGAARRLYHCRKPTVAAVAGAAITLGCELALACDFRIVDEQAYFQEAWVRVGLLPPLGGLFLLPRIIGMGRAAEMVLQGRKVKAEEALRLGLATEVTAADALLDRASALAGELGALPPNAYRLAKVGFHRGLESTIDHEWIANAMAQPLLIASEDFGEGVEAIKARRMPIYSGR